MSDCINGRPGCIAATEIHYHTPGYVHLEDEITRAFAALRAQLAEVTRAASAFLRLTNDYVIGGSSHDAERNGVREAAGVLRKALCKASKEEP